MIRRSGISLAIVLFATIAALACSGGSSPPLADVFSKAPWGANEVLQYRLVDNGGRQIGDATLEVHQGIVPGAELIQRFTSGNNRDETHVSVDASLKPLSSRREITGDDPVTIIAEYSEDGVSIKQGNEKQSGLKVPEFSYDNDSSLFLWRTIAFAEGYEARYITIVTNRRSSQEVTLKVVGKETVKVPAGEFTAWKLEIRSANAKQTAWFADTPSRTLLRYNNDRGTIFELTSKP